MSITSKISRTGFGFDSHLFSSSGTLVLGGIKFKNMPILKGHSDGDAVLHALIDALLGAASLGDIGEMFPDTSSALKGIDSALLLKRAVDRVKKAGWTPEHVDVTILADDPRLSPVKEKMKKGLAKLLGMHASDVNVKAKTQEGLAIFKQPGGIAVWAVATLGGR